MKNENKMMTDLIEHYTSAVIAHYAAKESKRDIIEHGKHCVDLEAINNNLIGLSGKVEGLKELLQKYYTKNEITLITDRAICRYEKYRSEMANIAVQANYGLDDGQCDEVSEDDNDEDTSSIDSTSQALYGRRYEETKRAEKEYEKAKQSRKVNEMQDAVKDNIY